MNLEDVFLEKLVVHEIGDRKLQQQLVLGKVGINPDSDELIILTDFLLSQFKLQEFYNFRMASESVAHGRVYHPVQETFTEPDFLLNHSAEIARYLYAETENEFLSHGYFFMAYFRNMPVGDELTDAIGLYYCHGEDYFIQPDMMPSPQLRFLQGIFTRKHDLACLIFNTDQEVGYQLDIIDRSRKCPEGTFWKDLFLRVRPAEDNFFHTRHVMGLTKSFVERQLPLEFEMEKKQQMGYLQKSMDYFRTQDQFSEQQFADEIFDNLDIVQSFGDYRQQYEDQNSLNLPEQFELNPYAVKKQAKLFRSIIKLDRNFHIYVHGDHNQLERGVDEDGRKYYKLYFKEEN